MFFLRMNIQKLNIIFISLIIKIKIGIYAMKHYKFPAGPFIGFYLSKNDSLLLKKNFKN